MKHDDGSIEFTAVIIFFFLSAVLVGSALFSQVTMIYYRKNSIEQKEKNEVDKLLKEIVIDFQPLKEYEYDNPGNPLLSALRSKYSNYALDFKDVSSGYHLDFLPDKYLNEEKLKNFLFTDANPTQFIAFRNNYGLSTDKTAWQAFLKDEAMKACVTYGWIHKSHIDSFAFTSVSASHKTTDLSALFPLVNEIPLINVNMVSPDIIAPLVLSPSFKIKKPEEKMDTLKNKMLQGSVLLSDISSYLEITKDNALFSFLGTKTSFWQITFCYKDGMFVEAIVAAIPKKEGGIQEITEYKLIDRVIKHEK